MPGKYSLVFNLRQSTAPSASRVKDNSGAGWRIYLCTDLKQNFYLFVILVNSACPYSCLTHPHWLLYSWQACSLPFWNMRKNRSIRQQTPRLRLRSHGRSGGFFFFFFSGLIYYIFLFYTGLLFAGSFSVSPILNIILLCYNKRQYCKLIIHDYYLFVER